MDSLERRFGAAGLRCDVLDTPLSPREHEIFQLDIGNRGRPRKEFFKIWPGAADNRVLGLGVDKKERQLVLFVQEPRRAFRTDIAVTTPGMRRDRMAQVRRAGGRVISARDGRIVAEMYTEGRKRHMLVGMDESHLFVAQLPRPCSTVRDAHRILRAPEVRPHDDFVRQGEWFFVDPRPDEVIDEALVRRKVRIGSGGNPHVADELIRMRDREGDRIYVRGKVRHIEHKTVRFSFWKRVFRNAEEINRLAAIGINWID